MEEGIGKGTVCVTGGTGFVASWLIMRLLRHGYSVNATIRPTISVADIQKDVTYLTNLPAASEKLKIFHADLNKPDSFCQAIEGCIGVFHVAHPIEFTSKEPEETANQRAIDGTLGLLKLCLSSGTVKRVVYTSSAYSIMFSQGLEIVDENAWSDVELIRNLNPFGATYMISKTLTERKALEFAEEHGLDLVSLIPTWVHGPFITPSCPSSVHASMEIIFGGQNGFKYPRSIPFVHVDDVASAHIFLLENRTAKGRYICSAIETTVDKLAEFLQARYPEYKLPPANSLKEVGGFNQPSFSSKKLLDAGFKFKYGLEELFDGSIKCCKERGIL